MERQIHYWCRAVDQAKSVVFDSAWPHFYPLLTLLSRMCNCPVLNLGPVEET